ncbi:NAD(P)-dependent oxidoreductase [Cellvibrio sp. UBA7661]|uniref:NAD-dependent epimerase/dehydratase family protein n=1 Tax=Cellvibrio sp. UBA7661 TaxID=1946311 RepID=UPI002F350EB0
MRQENSEHIQKHATVIGGNGFVGRALARKLIDTGWDVWVPEKNDPQVFLKNLGNVFYCAGLTADYLQRPFDTVEAHASLLNSIIHSAHYDKLLYLSSTRLYDGLSGPVTEASDIVVNPNNPRNLYDISKLLGESVCLQSGRASVARLSCVYFNEQDNNGFLSALLQQVINTKQKEIVIDSSPFYSRDYVHLDDVVDGLISIMSGESCSIYNLASGENVTNEKIYSIIKSCTGVSILSTRNTSPQDSPLINIEKMKGQFFWKPRTLLSTIEALLTLRLEQIENSK